MRAEHHPLQRLFDELELRTRAHAVLRRARRSMRRTAPARPVLRDAEALAESQRMQLSLPHATAPKATVIIPVYGKPAITWHCLKSLAAVDAGAAFETVVVDDASPDETPELLARVEGIRVVTQKENRGFIRACNAGAAAATAPTLVFLNNDTEVTPGWLGALLRTFDRFPSAGLVGGKLLFASGKLQEAGGTVFRDGAGSHYGRNQHPEGSPFAFVREVDYVSGACLAVPSELFRELDGFDSHFAPAYYEDTDLAFRVRGGGRSVLYQPDCVVYHLEGATHGRDPSKGLKRHQSINRHRFFERWREELLRGHPAPGRRTRYSADRRRGPQLLVFADPANPELRALGRSLADLGCRLAWFAGDMPTDLGQDGIEPLPHDEYGSPASLLRRPRFQGYAGVVYDVAAASRWLEIAQRRLPAARSVVIERQGSVLPRPIARLSDAVITPESDARRREQELPWARVLPWTEDVHALAPTILRQALSGR